MLDPYDRFARLAPGLITILPIALALTALPTGDAAWLKPLIGIISACGGTILLAAIARTVGRDAEEVVFADGLPTLQRLRHRQARTRAELAELHATVAAATGVTMPTADEEAADENEADGMYRTAITRLIAATRDETQFALLHKENRNYGFMRNLYGLRRIGQVLVAIGAVGSAVSLIAASANDETLDLGLAIVALLVSLALVYVFFVWLSPKRVEIPARAYCDRLFEGAAEIAADRNT